MFASLNDRTNSSTLYFVVQAGSTTDVVLLVGMGMLSNRAFLPFALFLVFSDRQRSAVLFAPRQLTIVHYLLGPQ